MHKMRGLVFFKRMMRYKNPAKRLVLLFLPLMIVFCQGSLRLPEDRGSPNIIFILIDALRADRVGYHGHVNNTTPTLDSFSKRGLRFTRTYSHSSHTKISVASLFTGLLPPSHGVREAGNINDNKSKAGITSDAVAGYAYTMAEIFRDAGYDTFGVVTNPHLTDAMGFGQGFSDYLYISDDPRASYVNRIALRLLSKRSSRPFFLYLHYMDVHAPYDPPPPYKHMFTKFMNQSFAVYENGPYDKKLKIQQAAYTGAVYDGQVRYWDNRFKKFLKRLKKAGLMKNTLVIVTSDHGDEFYEHRGFGHGYTCYEEMLHVPLTMVWEGVLPEQTIITEPVAQIDLIPSLVFIADLKPPRVSLPGRNLFAGCLEPQKGVFSCADPPPGAFLYAETYQGKVPRSLRQGKSKLIYNKKPESYEFYDLNNDPAEQNPLDPFARSKGKQMVKKLKKLMNRKPEYKEPSRRRIDEKAIEHLKSLGYFQE